LSKHKTFAAHFGLFSGTQFGKPCSKQWFLTGRHEEISRGTHALQHNKFLNGNVYLPNATLVHILRHYVLFGLVLEEMEVEVKFC